LRNLHTGFRSDYINIYLVTLLIRTFYETVLQIPYYDEEQVFVEYIIPKYSRLPITFSTKDIMQENIDDLRTVFEAIHKKPKLADKAAKLIILTDGFSWQKPGNLFLPGEDNYTGYFLLNKRDLQKRAFVSDEYFDRSAEKDWLTHDFLIKIGCQGTIRKDMTDKETYLKVVEQFLGNQEKEVLEKRIFSHKFISDKESLFSIYEGLQDILDNPGREMSVRIAAFLNAHINEFKMTLDIMAADHPRIGKNDETLLVYSYIVRR